jgi:PAS domain S-box
MQYYYNPYIWLLLASACSSLFLGVYALIKFRHAKGIVSFILSMLVVTIWSGGNMLEMSAASFSSKLFWANMQYFAFCYSPVTLLSLCMEFTGYDRWVKNHKVLWLALLPTIIVLLVWTDGLHGFVRYNIHMDYSGVFPVITKAYGPAFYIHALYSHSLNIISWILLFKAVFISNTVYRKQAVALLFGISLIIIPNLLYITGISPIKRFDITPVFFGPAGLIMALGIFKYKMFDLVPLARTKVIDSMDAGMIVLDLQNRVLDINPAFEEITGANVSRASARHIEEICGHIPELVSACIDRNIGHTEFSIGTGSCDRQYEAFLSPITDNKGSLVGRLALVYDITENKLAQQAFLIQQRRFAVVEERERLARDLHDNLGQVLGFINLQAQGIRQELMTAGIDNVTGRLDRLVAVTQSAHDEIRSYIRNARNFSSYAKDFAGNLKKDILHFEEQTGIPTEFDTRLSLNELPLKPEVQLHIISIAKEALNNIRKHSRAKHVKITLLLEQEYLLLTIEDDGRGFTVPKKNEGVEKTFGLNIMRERAAKIKAQINIESSPGKGSRIELRVPVLKGGSENELIAGR